MELSGKNYQGPLDRVLGRIDDLDEINLGILVQKLARERKLLESVFDVIRDGVLVLDDKGFLTYSNQQGRTLIGIKEKQHDKVNIRKVSPEVAHALGLDMTQDNHYPEVVMREMQITYPEKRHLRIYAVPIEKSDSKEEKHEKFCHRSTADRRRSVSLQLDFPTNDSIDFPTRPRRGILSFAK